jgi:hypothetical protein
MRRTTLVAGLLASALVIGYGGWLSSASSSGGDSGSGGTSQSSKPGEAPKG